MVRGEIPRQASSGALMKHPGPSIADDS